MLVALDIGGTTGRVAGFTSVDQTKPTARQDVAMQRQYAVDQPALVAAIKKVTGNAPPAGIGIAIAGNVDARAGTLISSRNLGDWASQPIVMDLEVAFGCPVKIINDAQAAAIAEAGHASTSEDFWLIIWGTGVGGSLVQYHDDVPQVVDAEPGQHIVQWEADSPPAKTLESMVGGESIAERFGKRPRDLAPAEWQDVAEWLARGLYNIVRIHPVERIVLGGGIALKHPEQLPGVEQRLNELLHGFRTVTLTAAAYEGDAGLIGALALLK